MSNRILRTATSIFGVGTLILPLTVAIAGPTVASSASPAIGAPAVHALGSKTEFLNWSGYGETTGTYTEVLGVWTVPTVAATANPTYSSSWIGIDGENNSNLIQTGTEEDYYGGAAHYDAWWEILPAPETRIATMTVSPGDLMSAAISKISATKWSIAIVDNTTKKTFSTTKKYTGAGTSVEWIEEATQINGKIATLAKYGKITFSDLEANNANPDLTTSDQIFMVNKSGKIISSPSAPSTAGDAFSVAYGAKSPAPPAG